MIRRYSFARRFGSAAGGATAVEFAMILPVFVALLFGTFEISRMMFVSSSVQYAVDRAARLAVIDPGVSAAEIEADITSRLAVSNSPSVGITVTRTTMGVTNVARVAAHYDHLVYAPFVPEFTVGWDFETVLPVP